MLEPLLKGNITGLVNRALLDFELMHLLIFDKLPSGNCFRVQDVLPKAKRRLIRTTVPYRAVHSLTVPYRAEFWEPYRTEENRNVTDDTEDRRQPPWLETRFWNFTTPSSKPFGCVNRPQRHCRMIGVAGTRIDVTRAACVMAGQSSS